MKAFWTGRWSWSMRDPSLSYVDAMRSESGQRSAQQQDSCMLSIHVAFIATVSFLCDSFLPTAPFPHVYIHTSQFCECPLQGHSFYLEFLSCLTLLNS